MKYSLDYECLMNRTDVARMRSVSFIIVISVVLRASNLFVSYQRLIHNLRLQTAWRLRGAAFNIDLYKCEHLSEYILKELTSDIYKIVV